MVAAAIDSTFNALREILRSHAEGLIISADTPDCFRLEAAPGPATLAAWRGRARRPTIPIAWLTRNKSYVAYHLMGLGDNPRLAGRLSPKLRARMQGKTCFNFKRIDAELMAEVSDVTATSIRDLRRAGFVTID